MDSADSSSPLARWPATRKALVVVTVAAAGVALLVWLLQPSPDAAFVVSAKTGVVTVDPLCGERLVWDLPPGRVGRRSALPGSNDDRRGQVTIALLPGARARLESTGPGDLRLTVSRIEHLVGACGASRGFYEATVDGRPVLDDPGGIVYQRVDVDTVPAPVVPSPGRVAGAAPAPPSTTGRGDRASLSLVLKGRVLIGDSVQLDAGWGTRPRGLLESGTMDLRVVPWFSRDRVTLRTESLEHGSLLDSHACLDRAADAGCPAASSAPAQGFVRIDTAGAMSVQLYSQGAVGLQSFGGVQHLVEIPESTAAWYSPPLITAISLLLAFVTFYRGVRDIVRDSIGWWKGKPTAVLALVILSASSAAAEPVEIRHGSLVGAGYSFRRGASCLVVTARHVVPEIGGAVTVLDRSGAESAGTRVYENETYDLALVSLPGSSLVACTSAWPDSAWLARATFNARSELQAVRHSPNGRETIVRLRYAGGIRHLLTMAPVDRLTIRESDSGTIVVQDDRLVGIVLSVDAAADRVNVLRFDTIDQLIGDRFRGVSAGPVMLASVLSRGRPAEPAWNTYLQSWLTEKAGRPVVPAPAPQPRGRSAVPPAAAAPSVCTISVDVLAWERVSVVNPDYAAVDLQLKACGKRGFLFEQTCAAGRRAAATTPRRVLSQKLTINTTVTPPSAPPLSKLETTTQMPPSGPNVGQTELEMAVLQSAAGPAIRELLDRGGCR